MFEFIIYNPSNPEERYVFTPFPTGNAVWIGKGDGESGEFQMSQLFELMDKFYKDNF